MPANASCTWLSCAAQAPLRRQASQWSSAVDAVEPVKEDGLMRNSSPQKIITTVPTAGSVAVLVCGDPRRGRQPLSCAIGEAVADPRLASDGAQG